MEGFVTQPEPSMTVGLLHQTRAAVAFRNPKSAIAVTVWSFAVSYESGG